MPKWKRADEGYVASHCGRWNITPLYWSCVNPQSYQLERDGKRVGAMFATQRAAKEHAAEFERMEKP